MTSENGQNCIECEIPLATRYQSAWGEHTARTGQRQGVLQFYLATVGAIYGFKYFGKPAPDDGFLMLSVSIVTLCSAILIFLHNRVIHRLVDFMKKCEKDAQAYIKATSSVGGLFYFYKPNARVFNDFHGLQRLILRLVFTFIFCFVNGFTIYTTWSNASTTMPTAAGISVRTLCVVICFLEAVAMFLDLFLDRFHLVGNDQI